MNPLTLILVLAVLPPPANVLRKCVAADGAVSYQALPCAEGSQQRWAQPVKPDPAPVPRAAPAAERAGTARPRASVADPPRPRRDPRRERCEAARRDADEQRDRLWNRLTFDQRSALDAKVARACSR
ncbi:hypothetical protein N790_11090 [Arenimonas malthae CC-JY-1]|uniref:DUF4124 domain-containing protein n=1 Tax=Arenimonas malthae CC-JY-1 TaxID=1384054 RepID=A0A091AST0_9GAMM|nr:hypothetical protein [Arenimonas malthae]KFN43248.1 hypothetical protein N790_11090 [Arenimonas malthae CC-JY-1]